MRKSNKYRNTIRPSYAEQEKKWQAESDLRTLKESETIKQDPARMKAVQSLIEAEKEALKSVAYEVSGADKD